MGDLFDNWPLILVPAALYCALALAGSRKLEVAYESLRGRITSEEDLRVIKRAINLNMMLAVVLTAFVGVYIGVMFYLAFTGHVFYLTAAVYIPMLTTAGLLCSLLYGGKIEKRVKEMSVTPEDPRIEETYRRWVRQWDETRLRLPD